ncbi:MAG: hypothetical protein KAI29_06665, partial [Cyclobacteriaceae bacterium]|nr:hypothetical protein [Cyclobacteriaceae bacterium]
QFNADDNILVIYDDGSYEITSFELTNRYEFVHVMWIEKFNPDTVMTAIYLDGISKISYIKKFTIETSTLNKKFSFISETKGSKLLFVSSKTNIVLAIDERIKRARKTSEVKLDDLVGVKGWRAVGNKFKTHSILKIKEISGDGPVQTQPDVKKIKSQEISIEKIEVSDKEATKEIKKVKTKDKEIIEPEQEISKLPESDKQLRHDEVEDDKQEKQDSAEKQEDTSFHSGDTLEMEIDMDKIKKKRDQLGLFDD